MISEGNASTRGSIAFTWYSSDATYRAEAIPSPSPRAPQSRAAPMQTAEKMPAVPSRAI